MAIPYTIGYSAGHIPLFVGNDMEINIEPVFTIEQKQLMAGKERAKQVKAKATPAQAREARAVKLSKLETGRYPLNPLREAFVHEYLLKGNAKGAYASVYATEDKNGNPIRLGKLNFRCRRLMQEKQVVNRIAFLQEKLVEKSITSREQLTRWCIQALEKARSDGNAEGMLKAVDRLARLHGLNQDAAKVQQQEAAININLGYTVEEIEALNHSQGI